MSGGHFDYKVWYIREMADTIQYDIAHALKPKPEKALRITGLSMKWIVLVLITSIPVSVWHLIRQKRLKYTCCDVSELKEQSRNIAKDFSKMI